MHWRSALGRLPREHVAMAKLAVWEGLDTSLADGLELEQRLARRLSRLSTASRARRGRHIRQRRAGGESAVNTVNFISIPGVDRARPGNAGLRAESPDLRGTQRTGRTHARRSSRSSGSNSATWSRSSIRTPHLYVAGYYAAAKAGLTFLPLNYRAKEAELEYMINTAETKVLLVGDRYRRAGQPHSAATAQQRTCVALGDGDGKMPQLTDLVAKAEPDENEAEVEDEDVSVLMYTSGTTSLPKGVMLSFRDFTAYVTANVEMADGTERGDVSGVRAVLPHRRHHRDDDQPVDRPQNGRDAAVRPEALARAGRRREQVTHAFVVPTMMKQVLDEPGFRQDRFFELTNLAYGGAAMPLRGHPPRDRGLSQDGRLRQRVRPDRDDLVAHRCSVPTTIGSTGTPEEVELKLKRLNSIGKPLPDVEIKVRDDDGKFLPPGEVGEIIIRTPRIMKGYAGREDDSRLPDGWRATGDLGWVDEDGYVFFAGRKDDMIIRGGENIAPAEIETVLMSHPAVDEAAVIGVPSVEWGQTVKAYVVLRPGEKTDAKDIQEFCRTRLASFKRPEEIEFIDALPKNALGKILRKELRDKGDTPRP